MNATTEVAPAEWLAFVATRDARPYDHAAHMTSSKAWQARKVRTGQTAQALAWRAQGQCDCCGRTLEDSVSVAVGRGPVCRTYWPL